MDSKGDHLRRPNFVEGIDDLLPPNRYASINDLPAAPFPGALIKAGLLELKVMSDSQIKSGVVTRDIKGVKPL